MKASEVVKTLHTLMEQSNDDPEVIVKCEEDAYEVIELAVAEETKEGEESPAIVINAA